MFSLDLAEAVVSALTIFVGSTILTTLGFGIGMSATPVLLLVLDPQTVVLVINTVSLGLFVLIIIQTRSYLPAREMTPVTLAGLLGVAPGVFILRYASAAALSISMAGLILILTVAVALNIKLPTTRPALVGPLVGFVVGVALSALGIGGPLLVLFALTREWTRQAVRGSLAFYFLAIELTAVIGYGVAGLFTPERLGLILIALIPVALGFGLATMWLRRMHEEVFRRAVIAVILATSLMVLAQQAIRL